MAIEQINGTTLFHEETGQGEPLVLVHGAWVDHTSWDAVVPRLAESFRVVTYDLRGHGQSRLDPPDAGTVHDDIADLVALDRAPRARTSERCRHLVGRLHRPAPYRRTARAGAQRDRPRAAFRLASCRRPGGESDPRRVPRVARNGP